MYLSVKLSGGLCNKLHCLFSACEIAIERRMTLVEPCFGWRRPVLFSDIFDIDWFVERMRPYSGEVPIMISRSRILPSDTVIPNPIGLWEWSERVLGSQRANGRIPEDSMSIRVLQALRLKQEYRDLLERVPRYPVGIHMRIEDDWRSYAQTKQVPKEEQLYVPTQRIVQMIKESGILKSDDKNMFFTSGQEHAETQRLFHQAGILGSYYYNPDFEYEANAAINFYILAGCERFIGHSRSSFSNLITLYRSLNWKEGSDYIYNLGGRIIKRTDRGLYPEAEKSVVRS